ncbi:MAG TPA: DUF1552 domain-containing protein [Polyangiales bacterium]|nr:DUF1552 domain-containing protein [Polyangiales bacterium]
MDRRWFISRRALLGGISAAGVAALLPRGQARAQAKPPTRLIVVHVPEGMWNGAPRPAAGSTNLGMILEALQPYQSRLLVLNNLSMKSRDKGPGGDGHHRAVPHMFTGIEMLDENLAGGPSVDQKVAQAIGGSSKFASLQFAVRIVYGDVNGRPIWSAPGRVVSAMQSPWDAYKRIFGSGTPTVMTNPGTTAPAPAPAVDLRKSALDRALVEIASLRPRLSATDRELLDSYQDSLRDIEKRLTTVGPPAATGCSQPMLGTSMDVKAEPNYPQIGKLQMDLMVSALQCGVTRVASLQWGNSNDQCSYSWLGIKTLGHDMAHNNNNCDPGGSKKLKTYRWYSEQAAYLLGKLSAIPEGSGTMLDNTLVLWASEFGESNGHVSNNLMWMLMGNVDGQFRTGRVLNCGGRSTNDLLTSICNAFGIADKTYGNPAYCAGPLPDLT